MAKHGESKTQKRISLASVRPEARKKKVWAIRLMPGTHNKENAVPLATVLRDILHVAQNIKEVKAILNSGAVKVDGRVRKEIGFPVGLFDVVELPATKKQYRAFFDRKERLVMKAIAESEKGFKLCKIEKKRTGKKGIIVITTNDGRTFKLQKPEQNVGDSIKVALPEQKILETYPLKEGSSVYFIGGMRVGGIAKIKSITAGTMRRERVVTVEQNSESFQTTERNIFVIGKEKPAIEVGEASGKKKEKDIEGNVAEERREEWKKGKGKGWGEGSKGS